MGETGDEPDSPTVPKLVMLTVSALITSQRSVEDWPELIVGGLAVKAMIVGGAIGAPLAYMMPMTSVPQLTALSHAFGAFAAALLHRRDSMTTSISAFIIILSYKYNTVPDVNRLPFVPRFVTISTSSTSATALALGSAKI